jgi:D-glycero-D-manno-heptose 1,7-bisphosphate phosphatase
MMSQMTRPPALFLDRDGVINVDHGYVHRIDQMQFIDGIFELCHAATERGYLLIVVTNQAGIGRGMFCESEFHALTDWMKEQFTAHGVTITDVFYCPDHPEHGVGVYRRHSMMRKPGPGMLLAAAQKHDLDLVKSVLVGDKLTDVEAGAAAGVGYNVLLTNDPQQSAKVPRRVLVMDTLPSVARWLVALHSG